jgi:hypothetical protein
MLQFIIPAIVIVWGIIVYKIMTRVGDRRRIRKIIKDACSKWEKEERTTEYHDTNYKPIWRKVA